MVASIDILRGIIILSVVICICISLAKKLKTMLKVCLAVLAVMEIGYLLSLTRANEFAPLSEWFRYDIFGTLVKLWREIWYPDIRETFGLILK